MKIIGSSNVLGTNKLPLQIIGNSKNPRAFKDKTLSPRCFYTSSKNAWQTKVLFKNYFENVFIPKAPKYLSSGGIKEVKECSAWQSPIVPVLKSKDEIRICVTCEWLTKPSFERNTTIEKLSVDLCRSRVFSKLDIKKAFHQVVLAESF